MRVICLDGSKLEMGRRLNIVKYRTFDGPLSKTIEGAKECISSQLREFQYLGDDGRFKVIPEYPEFAWFEGLVNAVTHRDYAMSGDHIRVMMYDDRLEITSPGRLPNIVTLENSATSRVLRRVDSIASDLSEDVVGALGEYELAALQYVYGRGRVAVRELAGYLGRSVKVSRPALKSLVEKGILGWYGNSAHDLSQYYSLHGSK